MLVVIDDNPFCVPTLGRLVVCEKIRDSVSDEYAISLMSITDCFYDKICHVVKVGWECLDFHEFFLEVPSVAWCVGLSIADRGRVFFFSSIQWVASYNPMRVGFSESAPVRFRP